MTADQSRWIFAAQLMKLHGTNVGRHIMDQIEDRTLAGDDDGVTFWLAIADMVVKLTRPDEGSRPQ